MSFLTQIWIASLTLSAASSVVMVALLIVRGVSDWRRDRRAVRSAELTSDLLFYLDSDDSYEFAAYDFSVGLTRLDQRLVGDVITGMLSRVRGRSRENLLKLLRQFGGVESLLRELRNRAPGRRITACRNLAHFDDAVVTDALAETLEDSDYTVRLAAARALADIGHLPSVEKLLVCFDLETGLLSRAVMNLFRRFGKSAVTELVRILKAPDGSEAKKLVTARALGRIGDITAVEALAEAVGDESLEVRATALRALAMIGHPAAISVVLRCLEDASWEVRTQAAICAGRIAASAAIPQLTRLLGDSWWWVRYRAAEALYKVGDDGKQALLAEQRNIESVSGKTAANYLAEVEGQTG